MVHATTKGKRDSDEASQARDHHWAPNVSFLNRLDNNSPGNDKQGTNLKAPGISLKRFTSKF